MSDSVHTLTHTLAHYYMHTTSHTSRSDTDEYEEVDDDGDDVVAEHIAKRYFSCVSRCYACLPYHYIKHKFTSGIQIVCIYH